MEDKEKEPFLHGRKRNIINYWTRANLGHEPPQALLTLKQTTPYMGTDSYTKKDENNPLHNF